MEATRTHFTYEENNEDLAYTEKRNTHADPDPKAEGTPHTVIEQSGFEGKYTTFNDDGTFKQYRGSGKSHGNVPRPNVKENQINETPNGPMPGK
ncbi:polymorphic toxin type 24 domain-containing protein [Candidatus Protochlamydia phocaeensis]|uniref:polymorphic toxin type 24 domain-containing protein n=1 Tax=Candidatus Protochlamydia phocaeensis TaxID=1414722 RepID=UPI000839AB32|nr:polymorphic toxin type 24 domain-containing protein [Candidatus Protochlamydia phocaeensis]